MGAVTSVHGSLFPCDGYNLAQRTVQDLSKCYYVATGTAGPKLPVYVTMPAAGGRVDVEGKRLQACDLVVKFFIQCFESADFT
jgi:hypothetical protein